MSRPVVFSRSLKREWLDFTVEKWAEFQNTHQVYKEVNQYLSNFISSETNRQKTVRILVRTWVDVDASLLSLRDRGVSIYFSCNPEERLAVHWVMLLVSFPLFTDICNAAGKLCSVQGGFLTAQLMRRVLELWGERSTVVHALCKHIKTMKDLGVIRQKKIGHYECVKIKIRNDELIEWMIYGTIKFTKKLYQSISEFERQKEYFPFEFQANVGRLIQSKQLKWDKVGGELVVSI